MYVTLRYLNLTGGSASSGGGVLVNEGAAADVEYCTISDNEAGNGGGVLVDEGGTANLEYCTIADNEATDTDGRGGGLANWGGTLSIAGSLVEGNSAHAGGGVMNYKGGTAAPVLVMRNNTVSGNTAGDSGGGVMNVGGNATLHFNTIIKNTASDGANLRAGNNATTSVAANIFAGPQSGANCSWAGSTLTSEGYNRISDTGCLDSASMTITDLQDQAIVLAEALAYNGGATLNFLPKATADNPILDIVPPADCEGLLETDVPLDQRGRSRPQRGWYEHEDIWCDAGAVERGQEVWTVCGPPLDTSDRDENGRCQYLSITDALEPASDGDIVIVAGIVTETVRIDKQLIILGPRPQEITPGTHMGVVQAAEEAPDGTCTQGDSVFTIASGIQVTIQDLNIRHGCAAQGGAIHNAGSLLLNRVTLYDNFGATGGAIYNGGELSVADSTIAGNLSSAAGAGIYNAVGATTPVTVTRSTLVDNRLSAGAASNLNNQGTKLSVGGSIVSASGTGSQCAGTVSTLGYNLVHGPACSFAAEHTGNPRLGVLRDNGGSTLTYAIPADSPAVDQGFPLGSQYCNNQADQRGRPRPFDVPNGLGVGCGTGAYEYGPRTFTVDDAAEPDPSSLLYADLQEALDDTMTDDIVEVRSGVYTGNFIAYRDLTIRHAAIDVAKLSPELAVDVRVILQASERPVSEQRRLQQFAGTTLAVQGYGFTGTSVEPSGNITVTLNGLTIRQGAGALGGGVHNRGNLTIDGCTIESNAAINGYNNSGVMVAKGEGGGILQRRQAHPGPDHRVGQPGGVLRRGGSTTTGRQRAAAATVTAATLANNLASRSVTNMSSR